MSESIGHAVSVFMGFFAIMNPVANTPIFLGLTAGAPPATKKKIALQALLFGFFLITVFSLAGKLIFSLFGRGRYPPHLLGEDRGEGNGRAEQRLSWFRAALIAMGLSMDVLP